MSDALPNLLLKSVIIDERLGMPLHLQVRRMLRAMIDEHFADGQLFWTEHTLTQHLGVSRITVRRALDELAREGVLKRRPAKGSIVCKESSSATRFSTVGVFVAQYNSDFLSGLLEQLALVCRAEKLRLQVYHTHRGEQTAAAYRQVERSPQEEGHLFLTAPDTTLELYRALDARGYRTVALSAPTPDYTGALVETDAAQAVHLGLEHLLGLGHHHITLLINEPVEIPNVAQKIRAFETMLRAKNIETGRVVLCGTRLWESSYDAAYQAMEQVWAQKPRPTAVFTVSDPGAWAVLKWLAERDIRVPDRISVLGYEDVTPSRFTHPALSSVAEPMADLAQRAVALLRQGKGGKELLSPRLIVRESTGPVRAFPDEPQKIGESVP